MEWDRGPVIPCEPDVPPGGDSKDKSNATSPTAGERDCAAIWQESAHYAWKCLPAVAPCVCPKSHRTAAERRGVARTGRPLSHATSQSSVVNWHLEHRGEAANPPAEKPVPLGRPGCSFPCVVRAGASLRCAVRARRCRHSLRSQGAQDNGWQRTGGHGRACSRTPTGTSGQAFYVAGYVICP